MLSYPVNLELDTNNSYLVTFPDIPEALSAGEDEGEALLNALDALETVIEAYFDEKREVPMPSKPKKGQPVVTLPALVVTKVCFRTKCSARACASPNLHGGSTSTCRRSTAFSTRVIRRS